MIISAQAAGCRRGLENGRRSYIEPTNYSLFGLAKLLQAIANIPLLPLSGNPEQLLDVVHDQIQLNLAKAAAEHRRVMQGQPLAV